MNSSSVPVSRVQPRSASRSTWRWRIWRGETATGSPSTVSTSAKTMAVFSCQGTSRMRREVGLEGEVAVAALPRRQREAVDGAHVDVGGEQVAAALDDARRQTRRRRTCASRRLPWRRPCMSVIATMTVSISPSSMRPSSSSWVGRPSVAMLMMFPRFSDSGHGTRGVAASRGRRVGERRRCHARRRVSSARRRDRTSRNARHVREDRTGRRLLPRVLRRFSVVLSPAAKTV